MRVMIATKTCHKKLVEDESGGMTILGLFIFTWMLMLGGLALDFARGQNMVTLMQNTADSAAFAAMTTRYDNPEGVAKAEGVRIAALNMPSDRFGTVMTELDIEFGTWNEVSREFTPLAGSMDAVRVQVSRTDANRNALRTTLMRFVGINSFNLVQSATVASHNPACLREGFVADQIVDMQSGNTFTNGFCIHSNRDLKMSSGNTFEPGVGVSMPAPSNIQLPNSGFTSNPGLQDALAANRYNLKIADRLDAIITGLQTPGSRYIPAYITSDVVINLATKSISQDDLIPGRIHEVNCNGNQQLDIAKDAIITDVVIITNCRTSFSQGARLENAVFATTHAGARSINGPAGVQIGRDDNCGVGGGAQLITLGSMDFANGLKVFGGQLLARNNILFTADGGGVEGASFIAGGRIEGTSNMNMKGCRGQGMEDSFQEMYSRLVQ
ncbi:MAG: hypothetical protein IKD58_00945 [Loktanella sp.]|nr:hypothetical protein [Loktanella sp.]